MNFNETNFFEQKLIWKYRIYTKYIVKVPLKKIKSDIQDFLKNNIGSDDLLWLHFHNMLDKKYGHIVSYVKVNKRELKKMMLKHRNTIWIINGGAKSDFHRKILDNEVKFLETVHKNDYKIKWSYFVDREKYLAEVYLKHSNFYLLDRSLVGMY